MSSMIKNKNIFKGFLKKNLPQTPVFFLDMITVKFHMDPSISFLRHASMFKFIYVWHEYKYKFGIKWKSLEKL